MSTTLYDLKQAAVRRPPVQAPAHASASPVAVSASCTGATGAADGSVLSAYPGGDVASSPPGEGERCWRSVFDGIDLAAFDVELRETAQLLTASPPHPLLRPGPVVAPRSTTTAVIDAARVRDACARASASALDSISLEGWGSTTGRGNGERLGGSGRGLYGSGDFSGAA